MPRPGRALERVVAALQLLAAKESKLAVSSPGRLRDNVTGQMREIDVLLEYRRGNQRTRVAFEVKDHSRKIDVKEIEAFSAKLADLDVDRGVMVSASGFTKPATFKAAARSLVLQSVRQSITYDWIDTAGVLVDTIDFAAVDVVAHLPSGPVMVGEMLDESGRVVDRSALLDACATLLLSKPGTWLRTADRTNERFNEFTAPLVGVKRVTDLTGATVLPTRCTATVQFRFRRVFTTFGYFENLTVNHEMPVEPFVRTPVSGLSSPDLMELVVSSAAPTRFALIANDQADERELGLSRSFLRMVTWKDLAARLDEVEAPRHHLVLAEHTDFESAAKFMYYFDVGGGDGRPAFDPDVHGYQGHGGPGEATVRGRGRGTN